MRFQTHWTLVLILMLVLVSSLAPGVRAQDGNLRYTIMVSKFENRSGWVGQWNIGSACGSSVTNKLFETGRFIVVGESDMREEAMKEQGRGLSGVTAQGSKTPVMGQMTPSQLLVKGVITHFQHQSGKKGGGLSYKGIGVGMSKETAEINITFEIVDSTTGMVVASKGVVGKSEKKKKSLRIRKDGISARGETVDNDNVRTAIDNAVEDAITWMVSQLDSIPWRGTVVLVEENMIYINRGQREGVTKGQTFTVGEAKVMRDPDTGEVLDEFVKERGHIRAIRVNEKTTLCEVEEGSDISAIYKGMGVMPRP